MYCDEMLHFVVFHLGLHSLQKYSSIFIFKKTHKTHNCWCSKYKRATVLISLPVVCIVVVDSVVDGFVGVEIGLEGACVLDKNVIQCGVGGGPGII